MVRRSARAIAPQAALPHIRPPENPDEISAAEAASAARHAARARAAAEPASAWSGCRVQPCALGEPAVAGSGLVLESIAENHEAKAALYRDLERWAAPGTVLATNTSSLSITALAAGLADRVARGRP